MNAIEPILAIVVCTYNRNDLLEMCLRSLCSQDRTNRDWQVIVVNNYHLPLPTTILQLLAKLPYGSSMHEPQPGLSRARNAGIAACRAPWIAFLDDDARAPRDYVDRILATIHQGHYQCFGGDIRSWWYYGRPRWLDSDYGSKPHLRADKGAIAQGFNWGSNLIVSRAALEVAQGFPEDIGMKGHQLGYSAENLVQIKLRAAGIPIGYDPDLYVDHVVSRAKLRMLWHIKAAYATGRDGRAVFPEQYGYAGMVRSIKRCISQPYKSFRSWIVTEEYPKEKVILDFLIPWALLLGKIRSLIKPE